MYCSREGRAMRAIEFTEIKDCFWALSNMYVANFDGWHSEAFGRRREQASICQYSLSGQEWRAILEI